MYGLSEDTPQLQTLIDAAFATHPDIAASSARLERLRQLRDLPYRPGRTTVSYQGEGLFAGIDEEMNQLRVTQAFPSPAVTRAANRRQEALLGVGLTEDAIVRGELRLAVRELYYRVQGAEARERALRDIVASYEEFLAVARARVATGATSRLELVSLLAEADAYGVRLSQARVAAASLRERLGGYVGDVPEAVDTLRTVPPPVRVDTGPAGLAYRRARAEVARLETEIDVVRAQRAPSFQAGYGAQYFTDGGLATGLQAGVSLSLFNAASRRREADRRLGVEVATAELSAAERRYAIEQSAVRGALSEAEAGVEGYAKRLTNIHPELLRLTRLRYLAGELSYLAVVDALERYGDDRLAYLDAVADYNLAAARVRYLLNQ